ncbi:hypothetical protein EES39_30920 [Streptomyces sp. ADI92-24]|nr:hypothetical protein EES39_30920 [Streptomyces sp. ADI92-24]
MNGELLDPAVATAGGRALWSTFGRRHGLSLLWMCRVRFAAGLAGAGVAAWLPPSRRHRLWPPTTTRSRSTPPPSSTLPLRHGQSLNCPERPPPAAVQCRRFDPGDIVGVGQSDCIGCGAPVGFLDRQYCCRCTAWQKEAAARAACPRCDQTARPPGGHRPVHHLLTRVHWLRSPGERQDSDVVPGLLAQDGTRRRHSITDSTPVECGRSRPTVKRSDTAGWAGHGYCASHSRFF